MRTCTYCDAPLPQPEKKGHRRREFCSNSCKQKHHLWHKQMKHDADMLQEPVWHGLYMALVERYKLLEERAKYLMERLEEERVLNDQLKDSRQYYAKREEEALIDCKARMRAVGMSAEHIKEFDTYWEDTKRGVT